MWILRRGAGFPGAALGSSHKQATREARQAEEAAIKARIFEIYRQFLDAEEVPGDGSEEDMPSSEETLEAKEAQADAPEKDVADDEVTKKDEPQQEIKGLEQQLKKGEKGYATWLKSLSELELEAIAQKLCTSSQGGDDIKEYLWLSKHRETVQVCSKCRYAHGCETCSYMHALRYVCKWGTPAAWWKRAGEAAALGASRR